MPQERGWMTARHATAAASRERIRSENSAHAVIATFFNILMPDTKPVSLKIMDRH